MKLDRWDISSFGTLTRFRAEGLASHPLVVLLGDNESGKSTVFEFLVTMMYGFRPANGSVHPYAPWNGKPAEGDATFVLSDGTPATVQRHLSEGVKGRLWIGSTEGEGLDLGNAPLKWTGGVSREMFRSLHALSLDELAGLDAATWSVMEERMLGGTAFRFLRPVREVLADLDSRTAELWQADRRRGAHRRIANEMRRLHTIREEAKQSEHRLLDLRELILANEWQIEQTEKLLGEHRSQLQRAEVLLPVLRTLEEIEDLRSKSDAAVPTDDLVDDPRALIERYEQMQATEGKEAARLAQEITRLERRLDLSDEHEAILTLEEEVRALVGQSAVHQQDLVHVNDLDRTKDSHEGVLAERADLLLTEPLDADGRKRLLALDMAELQGRVKVWVEARRMPEMADEQLNRAEEAAEVAAKDVDELPSSEQERSFRAKADELRTLQSRDAVLTEMQRELETPDDKRPLSRHDKERRRFGMFLLGTAVVLIILMVAGTVTDVILDGALTAIMVGLGIWMLRKGEPEAKPDERRVKVLEAECRKMRGKLELHEYETVEQHLQKADEALTLAAARPTLERRLVNARQRLKEAQQKGKQVDKDVSSARASITEFLKDTPIVPARLENPGHDLVADIENMRTNLRDILRIHREHEAISRRCLEREGRAAALAEQLDLVPPGNPMDVSPLCQDRLHHALTAQRAAEEAQGTLPNLASELETLQTKLATATAENEEMTARLAELDTDDGEIQAGLRILERTRNRRRQADELEQHLHATWPDWSERGDEARKAREDGHQLDLPTEARVELKQQIASEEEGFEQLKNEGEKLAAEFASLRGERTMSDIDGELAAWGERERRLFRRRDRWSLLTAIVNEAEDRWRERHQPAVLRAASEHLRRTTGGRYRRLSADGHQLFVQRDDLPYPTRAGHPLSRATREQIFLCLRIAMAEHLDGDEPLPMLLDEVMIHWDSERRPHGIELIKSVCEQRQVIMFTSQVELAQALSQQAGAHVIRTPARTPIVPAPSSISPVTEPTPTSA